jgi:hypothetical protein
MAKRKRTNNDLQNITHETKEHKGPKEDSQNRLRTLLDPKSFKLFGFPLFWL